MKKFFTTLSFALIAAFFGALLGGLSSARAQDQIVRPYFSIRSMGMGGVRYTTGIYDENFYGNPARTAANPKWKISILDITAETTTDTLGNLNKVISNTNNALSNLASTAGTNNHVRLQTALPAVYVPKMGRFAMAFGLLSSTQADLLIRRSYGISPVVIFDVGPAVSIAGRFLPEETLSVGLTVRGAYRVSTNTTFTLLDLFKGQKPSLAGGGEGGLLDGDLGATYKLPIKLENWDFTGALAINNLAGGKYTTFNADLMSGSGTPPATPRTYNLGISASRASLWKLSDLVFAFEITDVGNNGPGSTKGSLFRTLHMGGEARWGILTPRLGINQGYFAAGLGIDLKVLDLELATYGEEMSLNAGGLQDRRVAARIALQI